MQGTAAPLTAAASGPRTATSSSGSACASAWTNLPCSLSSFTLFRAGRARGEAVVAGGRPPDGRRGSPPMSEDAFLQAIAEDPGGAAATWLVLADWLEERGDPRAE